MTSKNKHKTPVGECVEIIVDEWFAEKEGKGPHIRGRKVDETEKAICVDTSGEKSDKTNEVWLPKSVSREPAGENLKLTKYTS